MSEVFKHLFCGGCEECKGKVWTVKTGEISPDTKPADPFAGLSREDRELLAYACRAITAGYGPPNQFDACKRLIELAKMLEPKP